MDKPAYYLYLSNFHLQESHAVSICHSSDLHKIRTAMWNVMEAMLVKYRHMWWYTETYALERANQFAKECEHMLDPEATAEKKKFRLFTIGFIITNHPMWSDNNGGYVG